MEEKTSNDIGTTTEKGEKQSTSSGIALSISEYGKSASEEGDQTSTDVWAEVKLIKDVQKILLAGIVIALVLLAYDLARDNSLSMRIAEIERDFTGLKTESLTKLNNIPNNTEEVDSMKDIIDCLKYNGYFAVKCLQLKNN